MKATTLLERQHRNLQQLCETVDRGSASVRSSLLPQLAGDLVAHIAVEEQVFYPAASQALGDEAWARAATRHLEIMRALHRALDEPVEGDAFQRAISGLRAVVDSHIEEEESVVFAKLEQALDAPRMRELGLAMLHVYRAKLDEGYDRDSAPPLREVEAAQA